MMARLPKRTTSGTTGPTVKKTGTPGIVGYGRKGGAFRSQRNFNIAKALAKRAGRPGPKRLRMPSFGTHRRPL